MVSSWVARLAGLHGRAANGEAAYPQADTPITTISAGGGNMTAILMSNVNSRPLPGVSALGLGACPLLNPIDSL